MTDFLEKNPALALVVYAQEATDLIAFSENQSVS
jgi:hypothetical protein